MKIKKVAEFDGPVLMLRAEGRVNALSADDFYDEIFNAADETDHAVIIMDAGGVTYVSSAGLRSFLHVWLDMKTEQRSFHVCNLKPHIQEVFNIIGFHKIMPLHHDVEAALAAVEEQ